MPDTFANLNQRVARSLSNFRTTEQSDQPAHVLRVLHLTCGPDSLAQNLSVLVFQQLTQVHRENIGQKPNQPRSLQSRASSGSARYLDHTFDDEPRGFTIMSIFGSRQKRGSRRLYGKILKVSQIVYLREWIRAF